ncbi:hypothetical protein PsorP6_014204 [Peronosclerospora sorghi]|uniref:Uncharacterized protein n=1 Tax=Peronosclerospora sorghi TaxID=230839 RepID=A0ACC0VFF1_9STRA|nr:hypothetical protein PsorP6_014204 [Peronosclerospora sorghi]
MDLFARAQSAMDHGTTASVPTRPDQDEEAAHHDPEHAGADPPSTRAHARVRALLNEMQASAAWGEKDHEDEQRRLLDALQACVLDASSRHALATLPKRMCAYEFKPGDIAWNCKVCQVDETCVMCNDCFISSDHDDHEVFFYYTHSGGCCDCGDTEAWAPEGFCTRHKGAQDADPLSFLPRDVLVNARDCIAQVMHLVLDTIQEARFGSILTDTDLDTVRAKVAQEPSTRRYSVIVHYNELQTSQEFATALNKAHPAIAYQMLKIVGETSAQKQSIVRAKASRDDVLELATSLHKHGILTSIVSCEYKAKFPLINSLVQWLAGLATLSDGLCRLISEKMCAVPSGEPRESNMDVEDAHESPLLRAVIMADAFLPKTASEALHSLLMALLADPLFKQAFAIAFTSSYRQLYREFAAGVGSSTATILAFSVQFFNRATFVNQLVHEHALLDVLVASVLETLRKKEKRTMSDGGDGLELTWDTLNVQDARELDVWDVFAMGIQQTKGRTLDDVDVDTLVANAQSTGYHVRNSRPTSRFLTLARSTDLPGRFELDVTSPLFVCRRYMSGLLDLRYVLQIDGVSETFVLANDGAHLTQFLLYLAYIQGACAETRRRGDHVEIESRGWVVTVEFVSTASDVSSWVVSNAVKAARDARSTWHTLVSKLTIPILEAFSFWLASAGKYFPPVAHAVGDPLGPAPLERAVSCHYPLQRTLAQLIRALSDVEEGLDVLLAMTHGRGDETERLWLHARETRVGCWHRVQLIEPVLDAIVWDAQVHAGLWVRNGLSVLNHSMNYGEPPFCARFRDLDLLLLQFSVHLLGVDWVVASMLARFGIGPGGVPDAATTMTEAPHAELLVAECLTLLAQCASELPPKVASERDDVVRSLVPYLRREIVQRLCVGPCAHSDLSKIANEFFQSRETLLPVTFSSGAILDHILTEVCVDVGGERGTSSGGTRDGKCQYRLKPELYAEYNPTFVHLTRKQHEAAHENWFQHRLRSSKQREHVEDATQSTWLEYPMVKMFLPCPRAFRLARLAILHDHVRLLVYESLARATTDAHMNMSVLSRAVHLLTLQLYVVEDVQYFETMARGSDAERVELEHATRVANAFVQWLPQAPPPTHAGGAPRRALVELLLQLNPWARPGGSASRTKLEGDQKHEIGRGIDWLVHRVARLSRACRDLVAHHDVTAHESTDQVARNVALAQRRQAAQRRAMEQMLQQQAAFAEQLKKEEEEQGMESDDGLEDEHEATSTSVDDVDMETPRTQDVDGLECAMCHATTSESSFMCYVGFAQCSAALSRLNGGAHGPCASTPMDEMHVGEDIPVHVRLCGHSVHHACWEAYHTSQFQRAITGGHHRHALNAVDVTKKEFLCPLCKSISNVLIPMTTAHERQFLPSGHAHEDATAMATTDLLSWLDKAVHQAPDHGSAALEQKTAAPTSPEKAQAWIKWLEDGLASLCMAMHKVACGAMQKSQPERYTTSACNALFHTLLCSFLAPQDVDPVRDQLVLEAMRFLPCMLDQVRSKAATKELDVARKMLHLLYYGGSDVLADGTIVLESEQPSTQTQTRKQSQWGKVRWPQKPLLLSHLGSVLMKGILFATSDASAVLVARLVVLARLVQSVLWYVLTRHETFTNGMADQVAYSDEHVALFVACFGAPRAGSPPTVPTIDEMGHALKQLVRTLLEGQGDDDDGVPDVETLETRQLVNVVACEVVPLAKIATFMIQTRRRRSDDNASASKPLSMTATDVRGVGFVTLDELASSHANEDAGLVPLVRRWVKRLQAAYDEMYDPHGVLTQWLTTLNDTRRAQLTFASLVRRDLHTMHSMLSVVCAGSHRTRYLCSLPRAYVKFYADLAKRTCLSCQHFPARPAVCLLCGLLLCAANTCPSMQGDKSGGGGYPDEANPGACTVHAKKCGRGSGVFLLVLEGAVLLVYWKLAAYVGSLYVDEYGEEFGERNRELSKGRPLYLNQERRDRLVRLWRRHEIPNEVVKIQNSSERVIRNSHY